MSVVGHIVEGKAVAVFHWGVIVGAGLSRVGLIDGHLRRPGRLRR